MARTSSIKAVIEARCPRCRKGKIFRGPMYGLSLQKTNEICSYCGFRFEIEPGYFYAAMYVSYAMNVAQIIAVGIATFVLSGGSESPWLYIGIITAAVIAFAPLNYRYSRVILLHWLSPKVKYDHYYDSE